MNLGQIPVGFWIAAFSVLFALVANAAWGRIKDARATVREAEEIVSTNSTLKATVAAQTTCIESLEGELAVVRADLVKALDRIKKLEELVDRYEIVGEIRHRRHAAQAETEA